MILTCTKCGSRHPLSDDDAHLFYPRFFCLSCGEKLAVPLDEKRYEELGRQNDRDRRVGNLDGVEGPETSRRVQLDDSKQGTEGG
jgi:hypothetical protein